MRDYSKIFGEPGKGVHAYRVGGLAIVDLALTGLLAFVLNRFRVDMSLIVIFIILIILAVAVHRAYGVNTALNSEIFCEPPPHSGLY